MAHQPMPCHVSLEGLCTVFSLLPGIPSPSRRRPAAVTPRRWQVTPTGGRRGMKTVRALASAQEELAFPTALQAVDRSAVQHSTRIPERGTLAFWLGMELRWTVRTGV
uniref:Uncharacterized protein n=1 Tax=Oryza nivara TaxID=4536 RepID=A0A0E0FFZ2_ORYNI